MAKDIIPLVTSDIGNYNINTDDDITIQYHNLSPIKTGLPNEYSLGTRPLFGTATTTYSIDDASRGRGIADFKGFDGMVVNDDTWYRSGGSTEIHTATPFDQEAMAKFTIYSQAGSERLVLVNAGNISDAGTKDGSIWFVADTTTAPTEIADADAPGYNGNSLCRGGVSLDGYFFVGDILGNIMNCNLDDITTWVSTSLVVAEREADTGIYIGRHKDHVFFLGTRSLEFFFNAANTAPASPLTRRQDTFFSTGCYHPNSVLELGDITYFIGKDSTGDTGLMKLENFQISKVGMNPVMDKMISGLQYAEPVITGTTDLQQGVYLATYNSERSGQFLVLTMPNVGTFALHVATQIWARWYLGGTPDNNGGITDWTSPKIFPLTASLNRSGANASQPNRYMLLNALVSSETIETGTSGYQTTAEANAVGIAAENTSDADSIFFRPDQSDGSKIWVFTGIAQSGHTDAIIYTYDLSTPFLLSSATLASTTILTDLSGAISDNSPQGACWSYDGLKIYTLSVDPRDEIRSYDCSVAFDVTTAVYNGDELDLGVSGGGLVSDGIGVKEGGLVFFVMTILEVMRAYNMTGGNVATGVIDATNLLDISANCVNGRNFNFSPDGKTLYAHDADGADHVDKFTLTTAWDLTSGSFANLLIQYDFAADGSGVRASNEAVYVEDDGTDKYIQFGGQGVSPGDEFGGTLTGVNNAAYTYYSRPWDLETNERKRINNIRFIHYPDPRLDVGTSNVGVDWINTETVDGILPASFVGDVDININSMTARLYRAGVTRQRIFKLTFSGGQTQLIKGLELDYTPLRG